MTELMRVIITSLTAITLLLLLVCDPFVAGYAPYGLGSNMHSLPALKASVSSWDTIERLYGTAPPTKITPPLSTPDTDFYSDSQKMVVLSMLIYEYAALRKHAIEHGNDELFQALKPSKTAAELIPILDTNLHLIGLKEGEVEKRKNLISKLVENVRSGQVEGFVDTVKEIFDEQSVAKEKRELEVEDAKQVRAKFESTGGSVDEDSKLVHFHDTPEQVKRSYVHAITVNHDLRRVTVVFRGTENNSWKNMWYDWTKNTNLGWRPTPNPVEELRDSIPTVSFHAGFAGTLLGSRYDEEDRMETINSIMGEEITEYIDKGYRLFVAGHSLGAAVATLFAFYAASNPRITKPVMLFTYASPRLGDFNFRRSFKHLEEQGKLRHARIHNKKDQAAKVPSFGLGYKHVGMELRLRPDHPPALDYPVDLNWKQARTNLVDLFRDIPWIFKAHSCEDMLNRLERAKPALNSTSLEDEYMLMWNSAEQIDTMTPSIGVS